MEQEKETMSPTAAPEPAAVENAEHTVKQTVKEKIDQAKDKIDQAKDYVGNRYQAVSGKVKSRYEEASHTAREKVSEVKSRVEHVEMDDVVDQMRDYVRSNPGKALLISIGVGFVIGLVMRRTGDDED